ncbi:FAD-binding oxidoreductase [Flavobacteriaceae bacterium]|jgi:FAD/FMN-containing dehydrogenase|nr:FAD-binding oxidoreductase [Cryomorphaceae bacterium]MBT6729673.1 FAD-binding oxidoreductase [Cryomorphaceae bacterium]MBT7683897.1 FAD-binding oxidoreductase [Cryomorphaceae bacterium]MDA7636946.1 FAD-binding oxidoreductase [Flavobacteriaceae bacterium]MDA9850896.1 FAD-binding oxidoreductase [Flavobacteriaceae bacterium]
MPKNNIINLFEEILDTSYILSGDELKSRFYHIWKTDISLESLCLLLPKSSEEISAIVKICNDNNQEIIVHGGLTNLVGSTISNRSQVVISLERMNKIIEIDEQGKTITCESGAIIEDIINAVKDKDLLLPLNFGARGSAQIGGAVSTNAGGLRVFKYGMTRNLVMGIEAILPDGTIISSLKKLMKDNSGYDLKQLFIGSEGTLGIVTKVVLRLYRLPKTRYTSLAVTNNYQNVLDLLKIMEDKISSSLTGFELLWNETYKKMVDDKTLYNMYLPDNFKYYVFIEYMGGDFENDYNDFESVVLDCVDKGLIDDAVIGKDDKEQVNIWGIREDVAVLADEREFDQQFDISIPVALIGEVIDKISKELKDCEGVKTIYPFGHVADGNIHFIIGKDSDNDDLKSKINDIIYNNTKLVDGSISAEHGIGLDKKKYLIKSRSEDEIELMRLIKKSIDPKNILNPGRVI